MGGFCLMHVERPHPELTEQAPKLITSRQLPVRYPQPTPEEAISLRSSFPLLRGAQETVEGILNLTVVVLYPNFKFPSTTLILSKANGYLSGPRNKFRRVSAITVAKQIPSVLR